MQTNPRTNTLTAADGKCGEFYKRSVEPAGTCARCGVRTLAFCAALDDPGLRELAAIRSEVDFRAGRELFDDGDPASDIYSLISGCVRLFKLLADGRRQVTGFILPGEYFGMVTAQRFPYAAEAVIESRACRFPRQQLEEVAERQPELQRRMLHMAWDEVARMQDQILLLGRKAPQERVASFLLGLAARYARIGLEANPLLLPMSRGDIADYLGLTVETVSRTFTRLRKDGLIALPRSAEVVLLSPERLAELADAA
jgi:CRP/FNR family transcriptional regulator, anaerobic regulatory protein